MSNKTKIIVHCSDTPVNMDIGAAEIDQWHRNNGWKCIGYAYVIRRSGALEHGRDLDNDGDVAEEIGAHAAGFNSQSIGICLIGGRPEADFTDAQMRMLRDIIGLLRGRYGNLEVMGHRDLPMVIKRCPTFDVKHWRATGEVKQ